MANFDLFSWKVARLLSKLRAWVHFFYAVMISSKYTAALDRKSVV